MKKLFIINLLVVFATLNSHGQTNDPISGTNHEASEERNNKTALASLSAYQAGDIEATFKDYETEVLTYYPGRALAKQSLDSLKIISKSNYTFFSIAFPDSKYEVLSSVAEGDYIMIYYETTGTWKGKAAQFQPTGKSFKVRNVAIFKFNDGGKIID